MYVCLLKVNDFYSHIGFLCTVLYSTLLHLPSLRFQCVGGYYLGLLRLSHSIPQGKMLIHNVFQAKMQKMYLIIALLHVGQVKVPSYEIGSGHA
jgi:hypothetical protein